MSYIPVGDKTVQMWIDTLSANAQFAASSAAQMLQYINFGQQICCAVSKTNNLDYYKTSDDMATITP